MEDIIFNFRKELQNLGYSKNAVNEYPKFVKKLLHYSKENPQKIKPKHIANYHRYLQEKPKTRGIGKLSEAYIKSQLLAIKLFFEYLERTQQINKNPFLLKVKTPQNKTRATLTVEEIKILYASCQNQLETTIIHLCYGCGLRRTEVQNLNIKDIHFSKKLLFIRKGKGKKRRVIPLTKSITKDLKKYYVESFQYRKKDQDSFLITPDGNRLLGNSIYNQFKKISKRNLLLKQQKICLHSLRHSIATHLLENDMSVEMVRDFLGHDQLKTTQIYTKINHLKLKQ
ncbi:MULTISPECIES: tyrosine-type recombinase/integrase [Flavobacterium]|uniref:Tyrosine-type recombinase/integrase n=1 Tax=Flavobacterium jumunjinense TaxID=998845 RepID=A0ABV5GP24_9FLAO|nr:MULTISPECIES: tyrosine-type recombinase/integrase [Flavobacterium]